MSWLQQVLAKLQEGKTRVSEPPRRREGCWLLLGCCRLSSWILSTDKSIYLCLETQYRLGINVVQRDISSCFWFPHWEPSCLAARLWQSRTARCIDSRSFPSDAQGSITHMSPPACRCAFQTTPPGGVIDVPVEREKRGGLLRAASPLVCEEIRKGELGSFLSLILLGDRWVSASSLDGFSFLLDFFIKRCATLIFLLLLTATVQPRGFFSIMSRLENRGEWAGAFSVQIKLAWEKYPEKYQSSLPRGSVNTHLPLVASVRLPDTGRLLLGGWEHGHMGSNRTVCTEMES